MNDEPSTNLQRMTFNIGNKIFNEGDIGDAVYLIVNGEVELYRKKESKTITLAKLSKGEIFGEMALLSNSPRAATAVATESCEVICVSKTTFDMHLKKVNPVIRTVIQTLTKRLLANMKK